jgi:hypothetical protein
VNGRVPLKSRDSTPGTAHENQVVILVTASHTSRCAMQRVIDEAEYVLRVLHRMRDESSANPELFDLDASKRIDEAITRVEDSLQQARLKVCEAKQDLQAA